MGGKKSHLGAYPNAPRVFIKQEDSFHEVARVSGMGTLRRNVTRAAHHVPKTGIIRTPLHNVMSSKEWNVINSTNNLLLRLGKDG